MASPITANWIRSTILLSLCLSFGGMLVSAQAPGVAPVPAPAASPVRFGPNVGGYRILRNGTVAMGGSIFPPQNCPPGSFAREITLTQDSTERLSSMSFRCSDPENTVITEVAGNGDPATGPQVTRTASVSEGTRGFSQVTGNTPYYMASDDTPIVAAISFRAADGAFVSAGSTNFYNASVEQGAFTFNLSVITGFRGRKSLYFDTISLTFTN